MLKGKDLFYAFLKWLSRNITSKLQIQNVRLGLEKCIKIGWIQLYAADSYNELQMRAILSGLEHCIKNGSDLELVKLYLKPDINSYQMAYALYAIQNGLSKSDIIHICTNDLTFSETQELYDELLKKTSL